MDRAAQQKVSQYKEEDTRLGYDQFWALIRPAEFLALHVSSSTMMLGESQALPKHGRHCRLHAHRPDSDGSEDPAHHENKGNTRRRRISPEEAKLAQENIKKALNVERFIKTATM